MFYNLDNEIAKRKTKNVYLDKDKTVKLFVENYSKADIVNEALIHARVEENTNLNIPNLFELTMIDKRWAIVYDHVYGKTFQELYENSKSNEEKDEILSKFINLQIEMFKCDVPLLNDLTEKYKRKINQNDKLNSNIKYELLQRLDSVHSSKSLCHGDFDLSNVILADDGKNYIIDWSHATTGDKLADIANTYLDFILEDKKDLADKYLNLYIEKTNESKSKIFFYLPIIAGIKYEKAEDDKKEYLEKIFDVAQF